MIVVPMLAVIIGLLFLILLALALVFRPVRRLVGYLFCVVGFGWFIYAENLTFFRDDQNWILVFVIPGLLFIPWKKVRTISGRRWIGE